MTPANPQIFREYDIRGLADRELTDEMGRRVRTIISISTASSSNG